jgi:hypothetical protein
VGKRDIGLTSRLWWNWEVDRTSYPDWEVLVAELAAQVLTSPSSLSPHLLSHCDGTGRWIAPRTRTGRCWWRS